MGRWKNGLRKRRRRQLSSAAERPAITNCENGVSAVGCNVQNTRRQRRQGLTFRVENLRIFNEALFGAPGCAWLVSEVKPAYIRIQMKRCCSRLYQLCPGVIPMRIPRTDGVLLISSDPGWCALAGFDPKGLEFAEKPPFQKTEKGSVPF